MMKISATIILLFIMTLAATAETRVRITGTQTKSEADLLLMMGGRLEFVRSSPATPPRADDAAFILRQLLTKDGYSDVDVDWKIIRHDEIELRVGVGLRRSLGKVTITGAPADDEKKLRQLFERPARTDREFGSDAPPFREEDVATGLSFITQELNARGYWVAEAAVSKQMTDPRTGAVEVAINVKPGTLYKITWPKINGALPGAAGNTTAAARPFVGRPATTGNINEMRLAVEQTFMHIGYPDATIQMSRVLDGNQFVPTFDIVLGERVRLADIHFDGLKRTRPERIEGRLEGMEGEWYDETAMNLRLRQFLATGAFTSVRIDTTSAGEGWVDATLHFEEARAREITLGIGAGSYQGLITRAAYTDRNLFGNLIGFSAGVELSFLGLLGEVRVINPWLFGSDISGDARLYALMYGREGYTSFESGLEGKLSRKFGEHYQLDLHAGVSLVNLSEEGLPVSALGETVYTHPRIRITHTLDFRDNPILPKDGWHLESPLQIGAALGDDSTSYVMAGLKGGWYQKLGRKYQIGAGGEIGALIPLGTGKNLPIDLRLFNGGARSVRSFPERELGPTIDGYPVGGEAMWNVNVELIRNLTDSLRAVAFVDAGSLISPFDQITSSDVELAAGLGVRFDLPIGPVRLEYGFNLTRDRNEPTGTFHFAIGNAY